MSKVGRYFNMIGFGIGTFMAFVFRDSLTSNQDTLNLLGLVGGIGFTSLTIGVIMLINYRRDLKIEYSHDYKVYLAKSKQIDEKNKTGSDLILEKYQTMPDLKNGSEKESSKN